MKDSRFFSLTKEAWLIWALVTACYALTSFFRTAPVTLAIDIMEDFKVNSSVLAVMSSAFFYPYAIMQIPAGILSDRWGSRRTMCLFLVLGGAGAIFFSLSPNAGYATFGRIITGTGMAMMFVPALRIILSWFSPAKHVAATGLLLSCGSAGMLAATWPLLLFSQYLGWRQSMAFAGCVTLLLAALVWVFVRNTPQEKGYEPDWTAAPKTCASIPLRNAVIYIIKTPAYWIISIWFFCMYGVLFSFTGLWAGPFFINGYGVETNFAGIILFCLAAGATGGPALIGFFESHFKWDKNKMLVIPGCCSMAVLAPMLMPVPVLPVFSLPVWGLAFGVFCGGFGVIALTLIQDDFPAEIVGTATGLINIYTYLGSAITQVCCGFLVDANAHETGINRFLPVMWLYMGLIFCAFLFSLYGLRHKEKSSVCNLKIAQF